MKTLIDEIKTAQEAGWTGEKKPRSRKGAAELGAKHAARVATKRAVIDTVGNNTLGAILALLAGRLISKKI